LYNASRLRVSGFYRNRSALDDKLIVDLADLSLSLYVAVRKFAQKAIETVVQYYDGTKTILMSKFFDALKREVYVYEVDRADLFVL